MPYRLPPSPIPEIIDAPPTPALSVSPDRETMALLGRANLPGIAELAEPELRLAGVRINPRTNGPSRAGSFNSLTFRPLHGGAERPVKLPPEGRINYPRWSPDSSALAFLNTTDEGIELWVAEVGSGAARRLTGPHLNATLGIPYTWMSDGRSLLVIRVPPGRGAPPERPGVPEGPIEQENLGKVTPARTYQDLLEGPHDEALFDHYFTGQLFRVPLDGGEGEAIGEPGVISDFAPSPSGEYLFVEEIRRPYSYLVPYYRFPTEARVVDAAGRTVRVLAELPLAEDVPIAFDAVPAGPRAFQWRGDAPATLLWAEALDGGDPRRPAGARDRVLLLAAPFRGEPTPLIDLEHRFAGIQWGRDDFALLYSRWWMTRNEKRYVVSPAHPDADPRLLVDRSYEDRYNDPGMPLTTRNAAGETVLHFGPGGDSLYLAGDGASPRGDYPFLDRLDLGTGEAERLWRAEDPYYEEVAALLDDSGTRLITRRESHEEAPNYFIRDLATGSVTALTHFRDPAPQLAGIQRQIITYPRADGLMLSGTLFLPPGYDAARDGPLPMLVWAYPREFRDAGDAAQLQDSPNRFSRPAGASHLFLLTQGYAVLDGPAMPIIGEGSDEPNDSYLEQLVAAAKAAVDRVVELGVADRDRIGIGGHSYGAFMTANLLAHSDLFRAGIARSGAYNRTLTPFGFQQEQRTYWEAPDTYNQMSPFAHAHRIREPILLIHGQADDNSGTFPVQSERFYAALKGHGATVRYVVLPHEAHGYRARESVLHTLAEMTEWMDRYVKNAPVRGEERAGLD
jgi:dipeptidyl aminopeptidase/acylaminoacyl peptidase